MKFWGGAKIRGAKNKGAKIKGARKFKGIRYMHISIPKPIDPLCFQTFSWEEAEHAEPNFSSTPTMEVVKTHIQELWHK